MKKTDGVKVKPSLDDGTERGKIEKVTTYFFFLATPR